MRFAHWSYLLLGTGILTLYSCGPGDTSGMAGSGGGGTGGGYGASSATAGGGGSGGDVTWTLLYNTIFGPNGTSTCSANSGCHTMLQSGFVCGTTKSTCYDGMVAAGLVIQGDGAQDSRIADPATSPLCDVSPVGKMPKMGKCITPVQLDKIRAWLAAGAPKN